MKVFANYLPQFHQIPENDKFWGEGFTDWVACKQAKPLFEGHHQPKLPLNGNYYDLSDPEAVRWQVNLARQYGISGFGIYHYWFHDGLNLLTRPAQIILENRDLDIEYFYIWDNSSWERTWSVFTGGMGWQVEENGERKTQVLAELRYGEEAEWKAHFDYLLPFFKDERYVKIDGKPLFALFNTVVDHDLLHRMRDCWDRWAKESGLKGVEMITRADFRPQPFDRRFVYSPFSPLTVKDAAWLKWIRVRGKNKVKKYDYDTMWENILAGEKRVERGTILSGYVSFDDTPRRGNNGNVATGAAPEKFAGYLARLLKLAEEKESPFVLITAWNEWGEGACLEPDEENGYGYLEAVKKAVDSQGDKT